jgi:uncharacterized membrane protein
VTALATIADNGSAISWTVFWWLVFLIVVAFVVRSIWRDVDQARREKRRNDEAAVADRLVEILDESDRRNDERGES